MLVIFGLFAQPLQEYLKRWFHHAPARIFLVPCILTAVFAAVLAGAGAWSWAFLALVGTYTLVPTAIVYAGRSDFLAVFVLWLPIELYPGKDLLPRFAWGVANITAHGTAVVLALMLFLIFRGLKGIKYNLPRRRRDALHVLIGFAVAAPILIALGLTLGFMGPFRIPQPLRAGAFGLLFLKTLAGVGLPEELLFRGLIQNLLMQRYGASNATLLAAAGIFGFAHINNAPAPNYVYVLLAAIAGFIYGKVFQRSSTILASASLHALVNSIRHTFFG